MAMLEADNGRSSPAEGFVPGTPGYVAAVAEAIAGVRSRMAAACGRVGRDPSSVALLAVTKFNPPEAVAAAYAAGVRLFGENRVQEAEEKFGLLAGAVPGSSLHLLGHLQGNKAKRAVSLFDCVESVDSLDLLRELDKRAVAIGRVLDVVFELHTGEESKSGFQDVDGLLAAVAETASLQGLRARGLMTMAPYTSDPEPVRAAFKACADAFRRARDLCGSPLFDILSMGMTNDYELAIAEGSTIVRIGTAIFGRRQPA